MNSQRPKVLHECFGEPMLHHVLRSVSRAGMEDCSVVVGHQAEAVRAVLPEEVDTFLQEEQLGTGHAVLQALKKSDLGDERPLLVTCGDIPGIRPGRYERLVGQFLKDEADCLVLSARVDDPSGYGRLVTGDSDEVLRIVEQADASEEERALTLINTGILLASCGTFREHLPRLEANNEAGEMYLTDVVARINQTGGTVRHHEVDSELEVSGINTRRDLVDFERETYRRRVRRALENGVTVHDPERVRIGPWVELSRDVELRGDVTLEGECRVDEGVKIIGSSRIVDSSLGRGTRVERSVIRKATVGEDVRVGPFCHLRPGAVAGDRSRLGNFVEIKKSTVGEETNVAHLSYLGDAEVGRNTNVGAGTITCNYDGYEKHRTVIGDRVFIGSNTELVAPVSVGEGALVGAGTTLTEDVPPYSLALTRVNQKVQENWVRDVWEPRHRKEENE